MNIYAKKFTKLQHGIFRLLALHAGTSWTANAIAKRLGVSATAVGKALPALEEGRLISIGRENGSGRLAVAFDTDSQEAIARKRVDNLALLHESGLVDRLREQHPGSTIILFGSFAFGEDRSDSDIDIAIIGDRRKQELSSFEKLLEHPINLQHYPHWTSIHKPLKENLCNGIVLHGSISL